MVYLLLYGFIAPNLVSRPKPLILEVGTVPRSQRAVQIMSNPGRGSCGGALVSCFVQELQKAWSLDGANKASGCFGAKSSVLLWFKLLHCRSCWTCDCHELLDWSSGCGGWDSNIKIPDIIGTEMTKPERNFKCKVGWLTEIWKNRDNTNLSAFRRKTRSENS